MKRLFYYMTLIVAVLLTACTSDEIIDNEQPLPEGMGRIRLTICTPENNPNLTRAVNANPWEAPDHDWEKLHSFRILICNTSNEIVDIIERIEPTMTAVEGTSYPYQQSATVTSSSLIPGSYKVYATANYADGYTVGATIDLDRTVKFPTFNGYSETNIPMTGKLDNTVTVTANQETDAGIITVWRVIGKLQFEFTNETSQQVKILGIEVEPINQASASGPGIYLFSKDDLTSEANLMSLFPSEATKTVSAIWALNTSTLKTTASVSLGGVFATTELSLDGGENSKLDATKGLRTAGTASLYKFEAKEGGIGDSRDYAAVITFKVTPKAGMTFTPKNLSFKACRGGTNGGYFDIVTVINGTSTEVATGVRPERYSTSPYFSTYSYPINESEPALTGETLVKIYVYGLSKGKDYAFGDVVISGDVTNNTGSALQEHLTLPSGALTDVGTVTYTPASSEQAIVGNGGTRNLFFYVNETDATFTTKENQLSLRFKIQRNGYTEELRYGVTTPYIDGLTGGNGFNVIRRNDWIHIPIHITDWQLRIEPLAFVPIAGYPASVVSSDGLTATFSTGGFIILQPFVKKYNDNTWLDFSDPNVTFVSVSWTNSDGTNVSGANKIVKTAFAYDNMNHCIVGELNNSLTSGPHKTTLTINVKLGPTGSQYDYSFTFNVVLQK